MHVEGVRRKRLAALRKRKLDLRSQHSKHDTSKTGGSGSDTAKRLTREEAEIDQEISLLHCARRDLF